MSSTQVEDAEVLSQQSVAGVWSILRLKAAQLATVVQPGMRVQLHDSSAAAAPIMRAKARTGAIDLLFRTDESIGENVAPYKAGDRVSISALLGDRFQSAISKTRPVLIGERLGIASIIFLAEVIREREAESKPLVFMGTRDTFPFRTRPSTILLPDIPEGVIACMPLLEEWGIPSRLANTEDAPGCFDGSVIELAAIWLRSLDRSAIEQVEVFASGDGELVRATTELAEQFAIPCQTVQLD